MPNLRYEPHHKICNLRYEPLVNFGFCRLQHGLTDFHNLNIACYTALASRIVVHIGQRHALMEISLLHIGQIFFALN